MDKSFIATATFYPRIEDLVAAQRAYMRWAHRRPGGYAVLVLGAIASTAIVFTYNSEASAIMALIPAGIIVAVMLVARLVVYLAIPVVAQRTFKVQKNLHHEWRVELSEAGVRASTPNQDSFVAWDDYIAWSEDDRIVLLYQSDRLFQFMPTPAFAPEGLAFFRKKVAGLPRR